MKLAQYKTKDSTTRQLGALVGDRLIHLASLAREVERAGGRTVAWLTEAATTLGLILRGDDALAEIESLVGEASQRGTNLGPLSVPPSEVEFLPPVQPGKIVAIGRNYIDHAIEEGAAPPEAPLIFTKLSNSLSAHNAPIVLPAISQQVDFEAELAVVIGRRAKRVTEAEAMEYVFGYTLINDVSARDLQFGDGQWVRGKGLDTFAPLGPFITTRDEVSDPHRLKIEGRLNGQVMQSANTGQMIFKVPVLVSYISQGITLEPGDIIATGTPEGVGVFRQPPIFLKPGDVYEVTIEGLGTLRNPVEGGCHA
jgi:2-keto-4-pentenoate hydratase/2-oxohepta-3-ene-1,7-dioic acid hydratase in catechol pathway